MLARSVFIIYVFAATFLLLPAKTSAQSSDVPYYYTPLAVPMNNRFVPDRRAACLYAAQRVRSCTTKRIRTYPQEKKKDSSVVSIHFFHPNGFVDSMFTFFDPAHMTYAVRNTGPFKYTKVGGRVTSEMTVDCSSDSLLTLRGAPNSKTETPAPTFRGKVTRWFDANGYLCKSTDMAGGLLKYNDSWAGSWNVMKKIRIDSAGRLLEQEVYLSHWWFFRGPSRKYVYRYDDKGFLIEQTEIFYEGKRVKLIEQRTYAYTFRE